MVYLHVSIIVFFWLVPRHLRARRQRRRFFLTTQASTLRLLWSFGRSWIHGVCQLVGRKPCHPCSFVIPYFLLLCCSRVSTCTIDSGLIRAGLLHVKQLVPLESSFFINALLSCAGVEKGRWTWMMSMFMNSSAVVGRRIVNFRARAHRRSSWCSALYLKNVFSFFYPLTQGASLKRIFWPLHGLAS